jgi:Arc/MetJ-type ribon-helix-helix transcriptional regulator
MGEITVQLSAPLSDSIRELADKKFNGSLTEVLNTALEFYLENHERKREQLKNVVQQIQQEVETQGGFDEKDLERRMREYRRVKYSKPR